MDEFDKKTRTGQEKKERKEKGANLQPVVLRVCGATLRHRPVGLFQQPLRTHIVVGGVPGLRGHRQQIRQDDPIVVAIVDQNRPHRVGTVDGIKPCCSDPIFQRERSNASG